MTCYHTVRSIYFIENAHADAVKIGITGDIRKRFRVLQAASPTPLRLLATIDGSLMQEQRLHECMKPFHIHSEWFSGDAGRCVAGIAVSIGAKAFHEWVWETTRNQFSDEPAVPRDPELDSLAACIEAARQEFAP